VDCDYTTLDVDLQNQAECVMRGYVTRQGAIERPRRTPAKVTLYGGAVPDHAQAQTQHAAPGQQRGLCVEAVNRRDRLDGRQP
jgi:hypothetical protein